VITPSGRSVPDVGPRRLALTPQAVDAAIALCVAPRGIRLAHLAEVLDAPVSSAQAGLRALLANGLAGRSGTPPVYSLSNHPARDALVAFVLVLPEPAHVLAVILRASPAVVFAAVDRSGFIAGLDRGATGAARQRLETALATIAAARPQSPPVTVLPIDELVRLRPVSVDLRTRLAAAITIKGALPPLPEPPGATRQGARRTTVRTPIA
jgi:hypothetical protein